MNNTRRPDRSAQQPGNNYAFIDAQNLNMGTQKMGWKLNWRKFRDMLKAEYGVSKAFLFIGYMPENEDLYKQMQESGYLVVLKPTMAMYTSEDKGQESSHSTSSGRGGKSSETGEQKAGGKEPEHRKIETKGNVDAELVLWAVKEIPHYDRAVIVSGDGDFYSTVEYLEKQGKLKHIMTPNWMYSTLLKPFDPYIVRLDQMRRQLEYRDRRSNKK